MNDLPRNNKEARQKGLKHYFTGKPCSRGHIATRNLSGNCNECRPLDVRSKISQGICLKCGGESRAGRVHCQPCADTYKTDRKNELGRLRTKRLKEEVVKAYGGECNCCSENQIEFLTIDHVYGGGNQHRKRGGGGGETLYGKLKKCGFPKDEYQLLCMNCNWGKHLLGTCPHKLSATKFQCRPA